MGEPYPSSCPKRNHCIEMFNGEYSACPTTKTQIDRHIATSPLKAAEQICLEGIEKHGIKRGHDPFKAEYKEIDYWLDYCLALPPDETDVKENLLLEISDKLTHLLRETDIFSQGRLAYHARARRLSIMLPAFHDRAIYGTIKKGTLIETHASLVQWLNNFSASYTHQIDPKNIDEKNGIEHVRTEAEVMGLLTRLHSPTRFPYPSTLREEASQARSENNHDLYTLDEEFKKTPIQVKTSKRARGYKGVVCITHHGIFSAVRETSPGSHRSLSVTELLDAELRSGGRDRENQSLLNLASMYIVSRLDTFNDYRRD